MTATTPDARLPGTAADAAAVQPPEQHVVFLVASGRVGVVPVDQCELMLSIAKDLEAQRDRMTQAADRLAALLAFSGRLGDAVTAAARTSVRLDVDATEAQIATFLLTQARARAAVVGSSRYKHVCRTCGHSSLSNPDYERHMERKRKIDTATRSLGLALFTGGTASPVIMANALFAFRSQKPDHSCRYCQGMDTEQTVVVFCPQCKALVDTPVLKQCSKCHHDFGATVDLGDVWRPLADVSLPPLAGDLLTEFRLQGAPATLAVLPDGRHLIVARSARSAELWQVGADAAAGQPQLVWTHEVGGVVRTSEPIMALSPDGTLVAVAKPQTTRVVVLRTCDGEQWSSLAWSLAESGPVAGLAFWPDGSALLVTNGHVEMWSLAGQRTHRLKAGAMSLPGQVTCSPNGACIVASAGLVTRTGLLVWSGRDCSPIGRLTLPASITDLAWSRDSSWLAVAAGERVQLLRMPDGNCLASFSCDASVSSVAVSAGGGHLAVASKDRSARVFDLRSGAEVARVSRPAEVTAVAFAPDGSLVVGDADGMVQWWALPS